MGSTFINSVGTTVNQASVIIANITTGDTNKYVMTASAGSNANSNCGLRNEGAYVVIKAFVVTITSTTYNLVLMRDPVG